MKPNTLLARVIRLAHENPTLRPHLLPLVRAHQPRTAAPKGNLFADNGAGEDRTVWKKNVTRNEAEKLIKKWDKLFIVAEVEGDEEARDELKDHPLKEGGDGVWVAEDGTEYSYTEGEWEEI